MKKPLTIVAAIVLCATAAEAQYKMQIEFNSGVTAEYWTSDIDSVVWSYQEPAGEYVDLGLSVKWATFNVGATKPEEYGDYFAWGETAPKSSYDWSNYKYCKVDYDNITKYCTDSMCGYNGFKDNKTILDLDDDAAYVNWGGAWRMPTKDEFQELLNNCTCTWTTYNGVAGVKVVSRKSGYEGNYIFFPAAGSGGILGIEYIGVGGSYWSSSLKTDERSGYPLHYDQNLAYCFSFNSRNHDSGGRGWRSYGVSVRPVCP